MLILFFLSAAAVAQVDTKVKPDKDVSAILNEAKLTYPELLKG